MTQVMAFWRDVEIFNIPDVPKASMPGRAPAVAYAQAPEADEDAPAQDEMDAGGKPKRVLHTFAALGRDPVPVLPWNEPRFHPASENQEKLPDSYAHVVYLGVAPKQRFVDFILRTHGIAPTADELYQPASGRGWLAGFIVDQHGMPVEKTWVPASFGVGSELLREGRSLDEVSWELQARSSEFDDRMHERVQQLAQEGPGAGSFALTWQDLLAERDCLLLRLGGTAADLGPQIMVESVRLYRQKNGTLDPTPAAAGSLMNSFFLNDLTALMQQGPAAYSAALARYLGPDSAPATRVDLLADPAALAAHAAPGLLPAGRWAASPREHLALAQQAAVYQIMDRIGQADGDRSRGLMAVNGPPGTGKTTLLKDVIADVIVQRALRISGLASPQALFTDRTIRINGGNGFQSTMPALRPGIVDGTEIVVTSSNNAAVENISFELPFSRDADAFPHAAYLPEVAALVAEKFELARKDPWGLLAGALGAKSRRTRIGDALMGFEPAVVPEDSRTHPVRGEPSSAKPWLDLARRDGWAQRDTWQRRWQEARSTFLRRHAEVAALRQDLQALHDAMRAKPDLVAQRRALAAQADGERGRLVRMRAEEDERLAASAAASREAEAILRGLSERQAGQETDCGRSRERLDEARQLHDPGWLARMLKKTLGIETRRFSEWKDAIGRARAALDTAETALAATIAARRKTEGELHALRQRDDTAASAHARQVRELEQCIAGLAASLDALAAQQDQLDARIHGLLSRAGSPVLPDAAFLDLPRAQQHRRSLWVSECLERARAELFLAALALHEATLMATAAAWFKVLGVVRTLLVGTNPAIERDDLPIVWQSLFFVMPVVSTTLASFGRLFYGMERESLGWVLVDEAGQAPPAAVAGALWRARRAVVVGDPLQIEPVMTVPRRLVEQLGRNRALDQAGLARWSPVEQSAQRLADRTMHLGATVGGFWTGMPLRTHRRCMSPMFDIANRIAYQDQMVQATADKTVEPDLFPSCWIDVGGPADGKVVRAQIDVLDAVLGELLHDWPQIVDGKGRRSNASVYVIAPFRDVADACRDLVKRSTPLGRRFEKRELQVDAGTVHTFQGKEASIVFLVLGSAPGEAGAGSRAWAAGKPNLLNVAVTRAQQRFYVIGNHADWCGLAYFSELAEVAGRLARVRIERDRAGSRLRLVPAGEVALS